jgi:regulator of RNase E activity RraA
MSPDSSLAAELAGYSTPTVLNGLKRLGVHPADLQTMDRLAIRCMSPALGVRAGFAVTKKLATRRQGSTPDPERDRELNARMDRIIGQLPQPRILVAENVGDWAGPVCIWGEVTAHINLAMACTAGITNGPVRDLPEMEQVGFQAFAGGPGPGGGFVDVLEVGEPVVVGGVRVETGDLIHADQHGVLNVPLDLAAALVPAIRAVIAVERRVIDVCRSPGYSAGAVAAAWATGDADAS